MRRIPEEAVERYRRERFFADLHAAYQRLAADQAAWQDELAERAELDGTLADGLGEVGGPSAAARSGSPT